jgi:hypothetical protein
MIKLTTKGEEHVPEAPHHYPAWGGIKELLRVKGGLATRQEIEGILAYCGHWDRKFQPNTAYLKYAIKSGWLVED